MAKGQEGICCEKRLRSVGVSSLKKRRLQDDFIIFQSYFYYALKSRRRHMI